MLPSPPGIKITLARGAFGLISTAREPPILTVSSAIAGAHARPTSIAAAPKQPIHPYLVISYFQVLTAHRPFSSIIVPRLFESDGTTFSTFLLDYRLACAYRMLCEPQYGPWEIGKIAYYVGFNDPSHFGRCFRKIYGSAPRDIRRTDRVTDLLE
jgi:hypothetical protein